MLEAPENDNDDFRLPVQTEITCLKCHEKFVLTFTRFEPSDVAIGFCLSCSKMLAANGIDNPFSVSAT